MVVGGGVVVVVVAVVRGGGAGGRVLVRGLVVVGRTVVGATVLAGGAGGAGCGGGSAGVVSIQDGTGNGTLLLYGSGVSSVAGWTACPHATPPNSTPPNRTATAATPTARRAMLLCTEAAPFLATRATKETLCDRADTIRCHTEG